MEDLLKLQLNTKTTIERFFRNYKKDSKERKTETYYELKINMLESYWTEFKNRENQMAVLVTSEQKKSEEYYLKEIYSDVENFYLFSHATILSEFRRDFPPPKEVSFTRRHDKGDGDEEINKTITIQKTQDEGIKLPKISLPTFSGDYLAWSTFYDLFKSLVHNNERLSSVQKLQYLKAHLEGEAKSLLSNITITSANYQTAWETLIMRYNNKRVLVKTQLDVLLNQPNVNHEVAKGVRSLLDKTSECLAALKNLDINVEAWDPILVYLITQRLPYETLELWEQSLSSKTELPTWDELKKFLEARFRTLEVITQKRKPILKEMKAPTQAEKSWKNTKTFVVAAISTCMFCNESHAIRQCPKFLHLDHQSKLNAVKSKGLCLNCLGTGHLASNCPSKFKCRICKKSHHTALHKDQDTSENPRKEYNFKDSNCRPGTSKQAFTVSEEFTLQPKSFVVNRSSESGQILLATALVTVVAPHGLQQTCRALIDPGSQASFVTENVVQSLQIPKEYVETNISGIGNNTKNRINSRVHLILTSRNELQKSDLNLQAFVLKRITNVLPNQEIINKKWAHLHGVQLADPYFNQPGRIDLLLGADIYPFLILNGIRKGNPGEPIGQHTIFGWILTGEISFRNPSPIHLKNFHISVNTNIDLKKFWELEELPQRSHLSTEDEQCERHFANNYVRCPDGRYQVKLPFIDEPSLGASRNIAIGRLLQMEKRFLQNSDLKNEYRNCIEEYLKLGHMEKVDTRETECIAYDPIGYSSFKCAYLPHHAILKPSSTSTKVRVVFDASRKTSNGKSLNDMLMKGPTIQETLFSILLHWRQYKIAFTADVQKMYRQIRVPPEDADYQRIVWRDSPNQPIRDYRLTTVTFGVKSAPFLAIRTMQQLARDEKHNYPVGANAILNEFYVDDLLSGGHDVQEAILKKFQINRILQSGGFELKKWASNDETILQTIPEEDREIRLPLQIQSDDVKALGMYWNPASDSLSYKITFNTPEKKWTKRTILSEIAKLFDPIGWLSPVIILGKILIQALWIAGLDWDDEVPEHISNQWNQYQSNMSHLQRIQIPRWIKTKIDSVKIDLHGFSDASMKAYAAAVYIRVESINGEVAVHLITAKTKVSPIKTISLPRLELCGATLLAKLLIEVKQTLQVNINEIRAWTDSKIVLAWLKKHPSTWETFIANRVSQIHQLLGENCWAHVPTDSNPADYASRGVDPLKLKTLEAWWNGPSWLRKSEEMWPRQKEDSETSLGLKKNIQTLHVQSHRRWDLLERFSSLTRLLRVTAYVQRWVKNLRSPIKNRSLLYLKTDELQSAQNFWLKIIQDEHFSTELKGLREDKQIAKQSKLVKLNPFLDQEGLIRMGGRLENASLSYSERHPIILPERSHLTKLVIHHTHLATMHGGSQVMLSSIRRQYWIINARNAVRFYNHRCIKCFRLKAQTRTQLMADLPDVRIKKSRPFSHCGIDYCGPFNVKSSKGRGVRSYKSYIAVFICMATKAMHLELVTDLSTPGFIAAFRRFTSRRGLCTDIYSDCGSNFIGANTLLTRYRFQMVQGLEHEIAEAIENKGIKWHFIPPSSPHFGGLWESGVKSVKTHLKRVVGNELLTYEEFSTLLSQIEASLNSRPLTELTQDPGDISALTPGHFLCGGPLLTLPEPSLLDINENRLSRYQYLQRLYQTFWKRWSAEYLHRLQQRPKWCSKQVNLKENDIVLVKDERLPPTRWLMGRIIKTHPGTDNLIRVVTLRTQTNIIKRPITKICLLPIDTTESS